MELSLRASVCLTHSQRHMCVRHETGLSETRVRHRETETQSGPDLHRYRSLSSNEGLRLQPIDSVAKGIESHGSIETPGSRSVAVTLNHRLRSAIVAQVAIESHGSIETPAAVSQ